MRNLKRALSLALAAVMVIGMMVVGAGAASYNDFTDKDEIKNEDAVSMVTELGIINGLPNGTFGPTQNIDRASFVKMLCLAYNGGNEPMLPANNKVSYVDTAGTWAAQYIEYCTNLNFVAGDGTTGKFNPTSPVTVSQAAKMLLTSLGYSATTEGYVGYDWQMNVDTAANTTGLYKGLSNTNTSSNLTRDDAAQMIYNALNAGMVKYEGVWDPAANTIKPQLAKTGKTLLEEKFGAVKVVGVVEGNEYANLNGNSVLDSGRTYITLKDYPTNFSNQMNLAGTFKTASDLDMIGKSVVMFVKPASNSKDTEKATILGSLVVSSDNKVVTTSAKMDNDDLNDLMDDNKLDIVAGTEYYVNYAHQTTGNQNDHPTSNQAGKDMTFIDFDNDGNVDYILQVVKTFGKVTSYVSTGKGSIYVSPVQPDTASATNIGIDVAGLDSTNAIAKVKGFEDVAKDDYVFFYTIDGQKYVEKAEYVDVTISSIKGAKVVGDGTTYAQSGLVVAVNEENQNNQLADAVSLGETARLYLDGAKNVVCVTDVDTTTNYLLVLAADTYSGTREYADTKVLLADGSTAVVKAYVDDSDKQPYAFGNNNSGLYTYSVKSDGTYKLSTLPAGYNANTNITTISSGKANIISGAVVANNNTIFVVKRGTSYSVYTGINNVPSMSGVTASAVVKSSNNIAQVVFVTVSTLSGDNEGIYVLDKNPTITGTKDKPVYTYAVVYEGKDTTLTSDGKVNQFTTAGYYENVEVSNGQIVNTANANLLGVSRAENASGGLVKSESSNLCTYTDKTVFLIVDGTTVTPSSASAIVVKGNNTQDSVVSRIVVVEGTDNGQPSGVADYVFICK